MAEQVRLSEEELDQVESLAAVNYRPQQIAKYLDVKKDDFMAAWYNKKHPVRVNYDRGQLSADAEINMKLLETAKAGNQTAIQIYNKNREAIRVENLKEQILFGGETPDDDEEEL